MATDSDAASGADEPEAITVYSDYVCPFCYLGRRSLANYQETREEPLDIDWHPFDLRAGQRGPDGEIDHDADTGKDEEYYEQARENVRRLQEEYGADEMQLELATDVDSLPAQVVSVRVRETAPDAWLAFDEAVFDALWQAGRDIGDEDLLVDLAVDAGAEESAVRSALDDETLREEVRERFAAAQQHGVTGVPTFAYDGYAARGAVPPEQLRRLVEGSE